MKKLCISLTAILSVLLLSGCGKSDSNLIVTSNQTQNTSNVVSNPSVVTPPSTSNESYTSNAVSNVSSQKLNCTIDMSKTVGNGMTLTQDVEITFNNNSIKSINMLMNFVLPDSLKSTMSQVYDNIKKSYDTQYGSINGVSVSTTKVSDTKIAINVSMDYANMSSSDRISAGFGNADGSRDTIKAELVSAGYTCY